MSGTKIINVLKDDRIEELLDIVKSADASEIIFVLPKKARAFKAEAQFAALEKESKESSKSISFMCSDSQVQELAKKYKFDVLSSGSESKPKTKIARTSKPVAMPIAVKNDDGFDDADEEDKQDTQDEFGEHHPAFGKEPEEPEEVVEEAPEEEEEYKEEEPEAEVIEDEPPYGTELDESGDPMYDEEEENLAQLMSAKTRGMSDIIKPAGGKNLKVAQKDKQPLKLEVKKESVEDLDWGLKRPENIWNDIAKPTPVTPRRKGLDFTFVPTSFFRRRTTILSLAVVVVLVSVVFFKTGSAKIEIKPRSQELGAQLKVILSPNFSSIDNSFNRIPGQLFNISKSASSEFPATAEKDAVQKSRGTITIYNEYSTSPQPLVATTRFEYIENGKPSGFVFRTLQTVTIPGMKVENGVTTPGKINAEVIADKAGQTYNIPAGNFGIVAWREKGDTPRYEKIYGKSSESMHGGILGKAKVVSEFDYNTAKDKLTEKVKNDIAQALKDQSVGLELITALEPKIDLIESSAKMDDAAETFTMTVKGSITTIGYKKDNLLSLVSQYVDQTNDLMVVPDKLELSFKNPVMDTTNNTLETVVVLSGQGYAKIDKADITANLIGKNETQIRNYLNSIKDIDSAKVILSPFWVKKIPKSEGKIDISFTF